MYAHITSHAPENSWLLLSLLVSDGAALTLPRASDCQALRHLCLHSDMLKTAMILAFSSFWIGGSNTLLKNKKIGSEMNLKCCNSCVICYTAASHIHTYAYFLAEKEENTSKEWELMSQLSEPLIVTTWWNNSGPIRVKLTLKKHAITHA